MQRQQLEMADTFYVMETKHAEAIHVQFGSVFHHKIKTIHINDYYTYGDKELIEIVLERVKFPL